MYFLTIDLMVIRNFIVAVLNFERKNLKVIENWIVYFFGYLIIDLIYRCLFQSLNS